MLMFQIFLLPISMVIGSGAPHLGRGFSLPETSVYQLPVEGKSIFKDFDESCFEKLPSSRARAEKQVYPDPDTFYHHLGADLGLLQTEIVPKNLYRSLLTVSESISTELKVVGAGIEISRESYSISLTPDCKDKAQLNENLINDFKMLPTEIHNPSKSVSWSEYDSFLHTYGTHFISAVYFGNKVTNYVFAKSSLKYTEEEMSAAVCLKLRLCGLTFCQFPNSVYERAKMLTTSDHYEVKGGTAGTRVNMTVGDVTSEDLYNFIRSETDGSQHVKETLEPLIAVLKRRFLGSVYFSRALMLQQYYEGFLVKGCKARNINGIPTQRFVLASSINSLPEFRCELARTGCRADRDCHLEASSFWTQCYCYGPTCITSSTWYSPDLGTHKIRAAQLSLHGSTYEGENPSCHYHVGPWCQCDQAATDKWDVIWPDPKSDFSHDLAMYRELYAPIDSAATRTVIGNTALMLCMVISTVLIS